MDLSSREVGIYIYCLGVEMLDGPQTAVREFRMTYTNTPIHGISGSVGKIFLILYLKSGCKEETHSETN